MTRFAERRVTSLHPSFARVSSSKKVSLSQLYSEIMEQPSVIRRFLDMETDRVASIGRALAEQDIRYLMIAARGTSDNAARYGQYVFGALSRLTVALATPSLFSLYQRPPSLKSALVIGISQSGQSPDIVRVLEEAHQQGAPTVAVTNDPQSPLAQASQYVLELHAGEERSVAATKTYTAQLAALALLALSLARQPARPNALNLIPDAMEKALQAESAVRSAAERIARNSRCVVVGRGFNYATAFETALKMKELAYIEAEPYSSADFRHGPIAMVETGFPAVLIAVGETMRSEMIELRNALHEHGANLVVLGDTETTRHPDDAWLPVPSGLPEWLTPLVTILPGQLLAYHLALARGSDPDRPRTLHKVTLTY
jgi:glucosamine--fructose-6-phosphate aminotransferase (isomerizing)